MAHTFEKTLLIANPTAQNGSSARLIDRVAAYLRAHLPCETLEVALTSYGRHAEEIAHEAHGFSTVLALGGDGLVNEVASGLMACDVDMRPAMGVIPAGSGNDYAKALGMAKHWEQACKQLLAADAQAVDVGRVNDHWFVNTLSFGLDAAIAHDTVERRKRTGRKGTLLYMSSGFDQLFHHMRSWNYQLCVDGGAPIKKDSFLFAVQIGPYYGGGFKITPQARLDDGLFDLCIANPPMATPDAVFTFLMAKAGKHTQFKNIEMLRAHELTLQFEEIPPAQMDGEMLESHSFAISLAHEALRVLQPHGK